MNEDGRKSVVKQELYDAISFFIERQYLVAQAMLDLGLDLEEVDRYGPVTWASSEREGNAYRAEPGSEDAQMREILEVIRRAQARQVTQSGMWRDSDNNEWQYFLHGKGCLLTNSHTHEKINWNYPNILSFDPYFFVDHLEWQLTSPGREDNLRNVRSWIQEEGSALVVTLIQEMVEEGLINEDMTLREV